MRVLLADDHGLFRDALVQYIEREEPDSVVMLACDVHGVMDVMEGGANVDLVLLDLFMPGMNGLKGLQKLRDAYPRTPVAIISGLAEKEDVERALAMGASGYFPKTLSGKALVKGIHQIMEGKVFVARDHNSGEVLPSSYGDAPALRTVPPSPEAVEKIKLTPREREVLNLLLRGVSNKEIARELGLQIVTVKLHVRSVCRKLGAANRTQAVLLAQKMGFSSTL